MFFNIVLFVVIYAIIGYTVVILRNKLHVKRADRLNERFGYSAMWDYEHSGAIQIYNKALFYMLTVIASVMYPITMIILEIAQQITYNRIEKEYEDKEDYNKSVQEALERWERQ